MRRTVFAGCAIAAMCAVLTLGGQKQSASKSRDRLSGIPDGKTRVVDMTYAINDKLPAWPGDEHPFEAKINATVEKDGYFTRSFRMLEHYGTHMDAPAHFPPGKAFLNEIPEAHFFGPAVTIDVRQESAKDSDYRLTVVNSTSCRPLNLIALSQSTVVVNFAAIWSTVTVNYADEQVR